MRSAARSANSRLRAAARNASALSRADGLIALNREAAAPAAKTVVVLGPAGGGIELVAGTLEALGVPMGGEGNDSPEDFELNQAIDAEDAAKVREIVARRDAAHPVWGWKRTSPLEIGSPCTGELRNLHVVAVFRDFLATVGRPRYAMTSDVFAAMERSIREQWALASFLGRQGGPVLLCSHEKALAAPQAFVAALDEFLALGAEARRGEAARAIAGRRARRQEAAARQAGVAAPRRAAARAPGEPRPAPASNGTGSLPAFYGIGAQKAGTTWLYAMLSGHPEIHLPARKEVHYWDRPEREPLDWYRAHFRAGAINGDITPAYAVLPPDKIEAVRAATPRARLLLSMRHPVERAWSFVKMAVGRRYETLPPDLAAGEPRGEVLKFVRLKLFHGGCLARGDYARTIRLWRRAFGDDALLYFRFERIVREPRALLADICRHVGADPAWSDRVPQDQLERSVFSSEDFPFPPALRAECAERCQSYIDDLERLTGERFDDWRR
jgi:hypothetical protein